MPVGLLPQTSRKFHSHIYLHLEQSCSYYPAQCVGPGVGLDLSTVCHSPFLRNLKV